MSKQPVPAIPPWWSHEPAEEEDAAGPEVAGIAGLRGALNNTLDNLGIAIKHNDDIAPLTRALYLDQIDMMRQWLAEYGTTPPAPGADVAGIAGIVPRAKDYATSLATEQVIRNRRSYWDGEPETERAADAADQEAGAALTALTAAVAEIAGELTEIADQLISAGFDVAHGKRLGPARLWQWERRIRDIAAHLA